jgi:hypothetical protein
VKRTVALLAASLVLAACTHATPTATVRPYCNDGMSVAQAATCQRLPGDAPAAHVIDQWRNSCRAAFPVNSDALDECMSVGVADVDVSTLDLH